MDYSAFVPCIGKQEDAPEVQALLSTVGVTKKLKMPKDDIDVRDELPDLGLSLIFKPEDPKSSRLFLTAVKFMSGAEHGYASYGAHCRRRYSSLMGTLRRTRSSARRRSRNRS